LASKDTWKANLCSRAEKTGARLGGEGNGREAEKEKLAELVGRSMGNEERRDRGVGMNRERLRKEVAEVQDTGKEGDQKLALADSVTNPIEAHVNALRFFRPNCVRG
jgi:hypothetical protein